MGTGIEGEEAQHYIVALKSGNGRPRRPFPLLETAMRERASAPAPSSCPRPPRPPTARVARPRCTSGAAAPRTASISASGASSTSSSWTCMIMRVCMPSACSQSCTATMAILIRSAAVPCMGALMAARSAPWRRGPEAPRISAAAGGDRRRFPHSPAREPAGASLPCTSPRRDSARSSGRYKPARVARDAQVRRQAEHAHAVDQAEVDGLGRAALLELT